MKTEQLESRYDPFAEFADEEHIDEGGGDSSKLDNNSSSTDYASYAKKHAIAKGKLKEVKKKADAKWQEHIHSSTRIRELSTTPTILEHALSQGELERFKVHASHRIMAIRSVVFCRLCGYWGTKKSQKLKARCNLKPSHSDGAHKLRRMMQGLHPDGKVTAWPDGHDARVPSVPVFLDWDSPPG